jgi:sterol 14-demethylase
MSVLKYKAGQVAAWLLPESIQSLAESYGVSPLSQLALTILVGFIIAKSAYAYTLKSNQSQAQSQAPPHVPHLIPFFGSMVSFGLDPINFLRKARENYGEVFTFTMFGRQMTYALGPDGNHLVLNSKLADVSAELAYNSLTRPIFGDDVVYDTKNHIFMEQKK